MSGFDKNKRIFMKKNAEKPKILTEISQYCIISYNNV